MPPKKAVLPPREKQQYRSLVKFYENKQFRKGVKTADAILKKVPEHGETEAFKGLCLHSLERKSEAFDMVRAAIKHDLMSDVCWHVYGILWRLENNLPEAVKCYRNALRWNKDNANVMRDLSAALIQQRDYAGYLDTRRSILTARPAMRWYWIVYALAAHLAGDHAHALKILDSYESTEKSQPEPFERSELHLYKTMLFTEQQRWRDALDYLDEHRTSIVDRIAEREVRAECLLRLGRADDAAALLLQLLSINSENRDHHALYLRALGLPRGVEQHDRVDELRAIYSRLATLFPSSELCRALPLQFLPLELPDALQSSSLARLSASLDDAVPMATLAQHTCAFTHAMDRYLRAPLRAGRPALFTSLKFLYSRSPRKAMVMFSLVAAYAQSLRTTRTLPAELSPTTKSDDNGSGSDAAAAVIESPSVLLWCLYFLAQHADVVGDTDAALRLISEAIAHTPTYADLYVMRGRFLKRAGNRLAAFVEHEHARQMDLADRYLNTKATLYALRCDDPERADSIIGVYTKETDPSTAAALYEHQVTWYELEGGDAYARRGELAMAAKKYGAVVAHYRDYEDDQFDFHSYCARKMTLRSYVRLLRFEDTLHSQPMYVRAVSSLVRVYLALLERADVEHARRAAAAAARRAAGLGDSDADADPELRGKSAADVKKILAKRRKAANRAAREAEEAAALAAQLEAERKKKGAAARIKQTKSPWEEDARGEALVDGGAERHLELAIKWAGALEQAAATTSVSANVLVGRVHLRTGKLLIVLRALLRAKRLLAKREGGKRASDATDDATDDADGQHVVDATSMGQLRKHRDHKPHADDGEAAVHCLQIDLALAYLRAKHEQATGGSAAPSPAPAPATSTSTATGMQSKAASSGASVPSKDEKPALKTADEMRAEHATKLDDTVNALLQRHLRRLLSSPSLLSLSACNDAFFERAVATSSAPADASVIFARLAHERAALAIARAKATAWPAQPSTVELGDDAAVRDVATTARTSLEHLLALGDLSTTSGTAAGVSSNTRTLPALESVVGVLQAGGFGCTAEQYTSMLVKCAKLFPHAQAFSSSVTEDARARFVADVEAPRPAFAERPATSEAEREMADTKHAVVAAPAAASNKSKANKDVQTDADARAAKLKEYAASAWLQLPRAHGEWHPACSAGDRVF